jgi:hypothetical protein
MMSTTSSAYSESSQMTAASSSSSSSFSIEGIEHSLLSRGKIDPNMPPPTTGARKPSKREKKKQQKKSQDEQQTNNNNNEDNEQEEEQQTIDSRRILSNTKQNSYEEVTGGTRRRIRRNEKARIKAQEKTKDDTGLKKEHDACNILYQAAVSAIPLLKLVRELLIILHISNHQNKQHEYHLQCIEIQNSLQQYITKLQSTLQILPFAPNYPKAWLISRDMQTLLFFQDLTSIYHQKLGGHLKAPITATSTSTTTPNETNHIMMKVEDLKDIVVASKFSFAQLLKNVEKEWNKVNVVMLQRKK